MNNLKKHLTLFSPALAVWMMLSGILHGQTTSRLSSSFIARGESALLEIGIMGGQPDHVPAAPTVKDIEIEPTGRGPRPSMMPGRRFEYVFEYRVVSYEVGKHVIPPVEVMVDGVMTRTEPIEFVIFNPDELQWSEVDYFGRTIRYASAFRVLNNKPFENETVTTEIKIYVPAVLQVEDWGIPDFERDGVAAWRFQSYPARGADTVNILGVPHYAIAYPSTITPTRTGKVAIGPAKIRLTTREAVQDPFPRWVNPELYLQVPRLELEAQELPPGKPAGYENAVGNFKLSASSAVTDVQEGDPITVDLTVSGSGNLDTMRPPKLANEEGWKIYGTTNDQRGDERRQLSGSVTFHQSIRPLELKPEIPSFRLVYFDPKDETYKTLTTEPIALQMSPSTAKPVNPATAVQTLPIPLERMSDILAIARPAQLTAPVSLSISPWLGHVAGGLIALMLIAKALWMRYSPRMRKDPIRDAKLNELRDIGQTATGDDTAFLKAAGRFIEHWLGGKSDPQIQAILAERDAVCFRAEPPKSVLDRSRREQILKLLRQAATVIAFLTAVVLTTPAARAADIATQAAEAYESAKYDDAIKLWLEAGPYQELSADTLYNIGNASYRSGSPGQAALYYRRALVRDSSHAEARQNLRFLERKYGAITVQRPDYQYAIARIPLPIWKLVFWGSIWLCVLALLVFPATRPDARIRLAAVAVLILGPILLSLGFLGYRYFPNDAEFADVDKQAIITEEKVTLHTDAARTSPEVIDAPPGSLCEILSESGEWTYVAFATKTRGWVQTKSIEKVVPGEPPLPPKFNKPKAGGKSA
ncbi:BatD family protein [Luteolibacter yonseiensis]|uniref:BatD family protein n=1 Tax=Luteolibacter yonseiensis TaxID=1144680 RepID=A0A934R8J6_9BACT|nr:BatD family protein [Luteolibacter yonseiensis]MBK1817888.1 BatD family protein [Luteolibacter yonseiensis]